MMRGNNVISQVRSFNNRDFDSFVLGADVGGTKTDIVVSGIKGKKPKSILLFHFKTKKIKSLSEPLKMVLQHSNEKHNIEIDRVCIAAAGPVTDHQHCKLTNAELEVNANEISKETGLSAVIINDFEAVGFGINTLDRENPADIVVIPRKVKIPGRILGETIGVLGAGTGLGKSILTYDRHLRFYVARPSEGGHADFPVESRFELEMVEFIKKRHGITGPLCYDEILSGRGLENIYYFLTRRRENFAASKYVDEINKSEDRPALISKYSEKDEVCQKTFEIFSNIYARCARNFALEIMALGGIYIAGGIAQKNVNWLRKSFFIGEFESHMTYSHILRRIPVFLVANQQVGLNGATFVAANLMDLRRELDWKMWV